MRLIDADALIERIKYSFYPDERVSIETVTGCFLDETGCSPTVDAVPIRHGRWVAFNVINTKDCSSKIRYMCNKCGRYEDEQEPYCNCGAKMDEVSE